MEDKVNQNISEKENQKLEKIAFISILLALVYIFLKFFNYIYTSSFILDSVLIPDYTIKFALKMGTLRVLFISVLPKPKRIYTSTGPRILYPVFCVLVGKKQNNSKKLPRISPADSV